MLIALPAVLIGWVSLGLFQSRTYSTTASFVPVAGDTRKTGSAGLASLGAQFGISVGNIDAASSPQFYADLITSNELIGRLVDSPYVDSSSHRPVRIFLSSIYGTEDSNPGIQRERTMEKLGRDLSTAVSKTGVVSVKAKAHNPDIARQIASLALAEVNWYNLTSRQEQAAAEAEFMSSQLDMANASLRQAEEAEMSFLEDNRNRGAPRLNYEQQRLSRIVSMRQQVYTSLSQAYQQAKLDEVRNTPSITVIEHPRSAARPDSRRLAAKGLLALFLGLFLAVSYGLFREYRSAWRAETEQGGLRTT